MESERARMEAVLGEMRGRVPGKSRLVLVPLGLLAVVAVAGVALVGYRAIAASSAFSVDAVEVQGAGSGTSVVRDAAVGAVGGRSLLAVDPAGIASAISALPRVSSVTVDRAFPHSLEITVVPERAVAIAPNGSGRVVLAASGRVLGTVSGGALGLPLIAAAPADVPGAGAHVASQGLLDELALASAPHRGLRFSAIGYGQDGLMGRTADGMTIRFGDSSDIAVKLRVARSVLRRASTGVQYVDVSVPAAPVLRQDTADPLTANAPPPTAPAVNAASAGDGTTWSAGASPAESIRTLFG